MAKNFTEASTYVDDLIEKKNSILDKVGHEVSEAVVFRMREGKTNVERDIKNLIKDLPMEDQNDILLCIIADLAKNLAGNTNSRGEQKGKGKSDRNDIFASRR